MKKIRFIIITFILTTFNYSCESIDSTQPVNSFETIQIQNHLIDWERSKQHALAILDAMPEDMLNFKPTEEVRSFSFDLKHIISSVYAMMSMALDIESPDVDVELLSSKSELSQALSNCYDWVISSLKEYDISKNSEKIKYFETFELTRDRAIFKIYEHQAHHKSKAIANMRIAGAIPPGYGPFLFD